MAWKSVAVGEVVTRRVSSQQGAPDSVARAAMRQSVDGEYDAQRWPDPVFRAARFTNQPLLPAR
jgi:hypothetical protein